MMKNYEDKHALVTCTLAAVDVRDPGSEGAAEVFVGTIEGAGGVEFSPTNWFTTRKPHAKQNSSASHLSPPR